MASGVMVVWKVVTLFFLAVLAISRERQSVHQVAALLHHREQVRGIGLLGCLCKRGIGISWWLKKDVGLASLSVPTVGGKH